MRAERNAYAGERDAQRDARLAQRDANIAQRERFDDRRQQARDLRQSQRPLPGVVRGRPPVVSNVPRPGTQPPVRTDGYHGSSSHHWNTNWRNDNHYDWHNYRNHHRSIFHVGVYFDPYGWGYSPFQIGWRLWPSYYGQPILDQRSVDVPSSLRASGPRLGALLERCAPGRHVERRSGRRDPRLLLVEPSKPIIEGALRIAAAPLLFSAPSTSEFPRGPDLQMTSIARLILSASLFALGALGSFRNAVASDRRSAGERARPALPAVQRQRRSKSSAQSIAGAVSAATRATSTVSAISTATLTSGREGGKRARSRGASQDPTRSPERNRQNRLRRVRKPSPGSASRISARSFGSPKRFR